MDWKRKLTSRKFWISIASFISSILVAFNAGDDTVTKVTAIITSLGVVIAYVITESVIDVNFQTSGNDEE